MIGQTQPSCPFLGLSLKEQKMYYPKKEELI